MNNSQKVAGSVVLKFMERVGVKLIGFVISIILARLLAPEIFGAVAILTVLVNLSQVFVQGGMNVALIQKKEADANDFSTVFWISLGMSLVLYAVLFFTAPLISAYYNMPELVAPLRVLALALPAGAYNSVQVAKLSREMKFGQIMICSLIATFLSGGLGVVLAYCGWGLWALVIYTLSSQVLVTLLMLVVAKWVPKFVFSVRSAKGTLSYGWKILISNFFYALYSDVRTLIIGKTFSPQDLAYYDRGNQLPNVVSFNIDQAIQSVMLPTLSKSIDDKAQMKRIMRRTIRTSGYVIFPMMLGICAIARQFVIVILTEKWIEAIPYIMVLSIGYMFLPVCSSNNVALKAMGRPDLYAKVQIFRILFMFAMLIGSILIFADVMAIAIGYSVSLFAEMIISALPIKKHLQYSFWQQVKDLFPAFCMSAVMALMVYAIGYIPLAPAIILVLQVIAGIAIYLGLSVVTKFETFTYIVSLIKSMKKRKPEKNEEKDSPTE